MKPPLSSGPSLRDLGENAVVQRLVQGLPLSPRTLVGPGDDCALLADLPAHAGLAQVFKTDAVVQGVHFLPETPGHLIGRKALCRGLSDLAAMGAQPGEALITLGAPADTPIFLLEEIYRGLRETANQYGIGIVGGETVSVPVGAPIFLSVALLGLVKKEQALLRSTAHPGDIICVTGVLGNTFHTGHHLQFEPRLAAGQFLAASGVATACMDLSDGLAQDLPRLAAASHCGFRVNPAAIPCRDACTAYQAATDGEDHELLFTLKPKTREAFLADWKTHFPQLPLTEIGSMTATPTEANWGTTGPLEGGWQHWGSS